MALDRIGITEPVPVCQSDINVEVATTTTDICEVSYGPATSSGGGLFHLYEPNALKVSGKAEGSCEINVTIPGADDGNGITETFTVDVAQSSDNQQD